MSGLLNKLITDGTVQRVGQIPSGSYVAMHITAINTNTSSDPGNTVANRTIEIWAAPDGASPTLVDRIEYANIEKNNGRLEHSCRIIGEGEVIWVQAGPGVVVRVDYVSDEA